jgi:UDP-glucose 4-epimerase
MSKYLVTGGAGFIGSHLSEKLISLGHEVVVLDNFYNGNLNNIRGLFNSENFLFIEGSILDKELLVEITRDVDHIFHLAAQIHVEKSIIRPTETLEINVEGTKNLLDICKMNKNISMTIASSAEVYGESYGEHTEQSPVKPRAPYAASKVSAEALCVSYYYTYDTDVRIVRNFNTFGPRQRSSGYGSVIAIFVKRALENKPLIIYGDGKQTRDYQYVDDVINGYLISENIPKGQTVNTGVGEDFTINKIAELVLDITKSKSKIVHIEPRPGEVRKLRSNVDKIKKFGHVNELTLEQGLKKYIDWVVKYDPDSLGVMK